MSLWKTDFDVGYGEDKKIAQLKVPEGSSPGGRLLVPTSVLSVNIATVTYAPKQTGLPKYARQ